MRKLLSFMVPVIMALPITALAAELTCPSQVLSTWTTYTCPDHNPDCCPSDMPYRVSSRDTMSGHEFKTCAKQPAGDFANQVTLFRDQNNKLQMLCAFHYADNSVSYLSNVRTVVPDNCHFKSVSNTLAVGAGSTACKGSQQSCVVECK